MNLNPNKKCVLFNFYRKIKAHLEVFVSKRYIVTAMLIFQVSFLVKLFVIQFSNALGADYGVYLRWADVLRGLDVVGNGLRYPPIYPSLLVFLLTFLDEIAALKVCVVFIYSLIVIPYFLLAKKIFGSGIFPVIASFLIAFNIFYSEMMGWGGNANILGLIFLTAFLIFWVNSLQNARGKRDMFLAAIFISLAIGSHYLLAAYFLLFFLVFFSLFIWLWCQNSKTLAFRVLIKTVLMIGLISLILSSPYMFTYTHLLNSAVIYETNFQLADQQALGLSVYLLYKNVLGIVLLILGIIGILFLFKENKLLGLTLSTLFISACLPIFFTLHPVRWVYFWPIPVFLGFTAFVKKLSLKLRLHRISRFTFMACMTFIISAYIFSSVPYLYEAVSYYNVLTPKMLDALQYLKLNTTVGAIIATSGPYRRGGEGSGHNYGWWIEGYADRRSVATAYLRFLIYFDERRIAENANILFSGTHVLLNDFVMVAETLPAGSGNPEIGVNIGDFYDKLLLFADNETIINCRGYNTTLRSIKPSSIDKGNGDIDIAYFCDSTLINKATSISNEATIEVFFKINQGSNANITRIFIPLFKADFVDLNGYHQMNDKSIALEMTTPMGARIRLNVTVDYDETFTFTPSRRGQEFAVFVFDNPPKNATIKFTFTLPKLVSAGSSQVRYFNAYELIEQMKIDYFMVNVNRRREFEWFNNDKRFLKEFDNEELAIFKVIKP